MRGQKGQRGENEGEAVCGTRMCVGILCPQPCNYIQSVIFSKFTHNRMLTVW